MERRVGLAVGTGSLYHHFRNKDELLRAAVEREVARCMADVERDQSSVEWPEDAREQMVLAARLTLGNIRRFNRLYRAHAGGGRSDPGPRTHSGNGARSVTRHRGVDRGPVSIDHYRGPGGDTQIFGLVSDGPFQSVSEDEFISALVEVLPAGRPPGVAVETYEAKISKTPTDG